MSEYKAKYLVMSEIEIEGKLILSPDKVVFEPDEKEAERITITVSDIKDVRFATEEDISALRVWLVGPVWGAFWKKKHRILLIDVEDEYGIIRHLTFEGDEDIEDAENELYDIRRAGKLVRESKLSRMENPQMPRIFELRHYWKCPICLRQNAMKAKICTRCGSEKPKE